MFEQTYNKNEYGFKKVTYISGNLDKIKEDIPEEYGVYIFRAPKDIPRVNGKSNIIYIGKAGSKDTKQNIRGRMFNTGGISKSWILSKFEKMYLGEQFTIDFILTKNEEAEILESKLLCLYLKEHYELPPANNKKPSKEIFETNEFTQLEVSFHYEILLGIIRYLDMKKVYSVY